MNKYSYEGMGAVVATYSAGDAVQGGAGVKLTAADTVGTCGDGDGFCGVAMEPRRGGAAVQLRGFAQVPFTGTLNPGWCELAANGAGGVRAAASGETGVKALVVSAAGGAAVICL